MYETYLQNEREFDERYIESVSKAYPEYQESHHILISDIKSHNRLSRIKEMKALEKELEESRLSEYIGREAVCHNNGLQLSLDKIREFIKLLEKEV